MKAASRLIAINEQFYQSNAVSFSSTRQRLQPGVQRLADRLMVDLPMGRLLDLGCGNGWLGRYLLEHHFNGTYIGLDASPGLLEDARRNSPYRFIAGNLADPVWEAQLPSAPFDAILAFAVLHHLPGSELQLGVLQQVHDHLITPGGVFFHSEWQFRNSPRLAGRILAWEEAGLRASEVDDGDALLDWRAEGAQGIRYVHQFSEAELEKLAQLAGFKVAETFYSDGKEGNLGLYQVWTSA